MNTEFQNQQQRFAVSFRLLNIGAKKIADGLATEQPTPTNGTRSSNANGLYQSGLGKIVKMGAAESVELMASFRVAEFWPRRNLRRPDWI
jgi:hypothetical protein